MKKLFSIVFVLVLVSAAQGQFVYDPFPYNRTVIIVSDTMSTGADGVTTSYSWTKIPKATDIAVTASIYVFADDDDGGDSLVVRYALRNSVTGAGVALTVLDTLISTADSTLQSQALGTIALSTMLGYDQIRLTAEKLAETGTTATAARFKLYYTVVSRAGGLLGDEQGRVPAVNDTRQFYYKSGYTSSTASETTQVYIPIAGITDLKVFVRSTDSLVADIYYLLYNSISGVTGSWTKLGNTVTHVQTSDTVTSPGNLQLATLLGYDKIKFYIDYKANSTAEASRVTRMYYYFLRRDY